MKINREIRADKVRVIGADGKQLGVMALRQALLLAERENLDLVEISSSSVPPVCKITDYGKLQYYRTKKEKEQRKAQHQVKVKEIKLKPNIDVHDFKTKVNHAREFLLKGNKVRLTCMFRGREMLHVDLGKNLVKRFSDELADISTLEATPKLMGRSLTTVIVPTSHKKQKTVKKGEKNSREQDENQKGSHKEV